MALQQPNCVFFISPNTFSRAQLSHTAQQEITVQILDVMYDASDGRVYGPGSYFTIMDSMQSDTLHAVRNDEEVDIIMFHDDSPWRGVNRRKFVVVLVCPRGGGPIHLVEQDDVDVFAYFVAMYMAGEVHLLQRAMS
ncbi:hypothetical protein J3R83DRAFT_2375 [Lanmaoa asiatica]|nr:hypothetical protein J3R83DRAFT_2375 [Lanmaoa asiatica]